MWHEINNMDDVNEFMESVYYCHDSCTKSIYYISGAYVNEDLAMYPINDKRELSVLLQQQMEETKNIELVFTGLQYIKLVPIPETHTCEIFGAAMFFKHGKLYWCDWDGVDEESIETYEGTVVCAEKARWRVFD